MRTLAFVFMLLISSFALAQSTSQWVTLKGKAPEYAGYSLVMRKVVNPISREEADLMVLHVDEHGYFQQQIELSNVVYASIDMGRFLGYIYLEPGQTYELVLPPFQPRSDAERFNPYFVPEVIELGIANEEAQVLNKRMKRFDEQLSTAYNENAVRVFARSDVQRANHIIEGLDSITKGCDYLQEYSRYAYGELLTLAYKRNKRMAMHLTFSGDSINMFMPAFIKSFNTLFKGFFTYYFSSNRGDALRDAYNQGATFDSLSYLLQKDTLFANHELADLVLMKGMYDAFYSGRYDEERIIQLYRQAAETGSRPDIRNIAQGLHRKVTWLRTGSAAPPFTLYRLDGRERSLSDYEGKFVYLNFMHTSNHTCRQELELLNVLSKQMRREMIIVTIIMDEDPTAAQKLVKENKYKWDFLHYIGMPKVVSDYRIKALPMYFVIDPSQKLRLVPAPSPTESFAPIFMEAQRSYRYEQLRKDRPSEKSIYDF
ncbi:MULTISPECIES: TlpA family protein disulfide reductase [unclassified Carboxylicivirga]|uniref:TlpA family protein disulfide reductase n=1 Tax=Carboxylicivirga TaxID=1628153 RepID=UPI003D32AD2F